MQESTEKTKELHSGRYYKTDTYSEADTQVIATSMLHA